KVEMYENVVERRRPVGGHKVRVTSHRRVEELELQLRVEEPRHREDTGSGEAAISEAEEPSGHAPWAVARVGRPILALHRATTDPTRAAGAQGAQAPTLYPLEPRSQSALQGGSRGALLGARYIIANAVPPFCT